MAEHSLSLSEQIKLQMRYAIPLLKDLCDILGEDVVLKALRQRKARRVKEAQAAAPGPSAVNHPIVLQGFKEFGRDTLEYDVLSSEQDSHISINVNRCGYAELAREFNAPEIGQLLLCGEDDVMVAAAGTRLMRSGTLMSGARCCDFRFEAGTAGGSPDGQQAEA